MSLSLKHPKLTPETAAKAAPLTQDFYQRSAPEVAKDLLGKTLVTQVDGIMCAAIILEVEAYLGAEDPASHAYRGPTKRNRSMFGPGGISYVYLSYGVHHCMNVVTGAEGLGEAVLLRAGEPILGLEAMGQRRGVVVDSTPKTLRTLASGPGKLTCAMGITLADDGRCLQQIHFKIIDQGCSIRPRDIRASGRIGISKAKDLPLRFLIKDSPFISRP